MGNIDRYFFKPKSLSSHTQFFKLSNNDDHPDCNDKLLGSQNTVNWHVYPQ
jgi:hypothetical protein